MPFAIVDIETTGGHASASSITEVAIFIHDGQKVIDSYETLVNPEQDIPHYITGLTGINNAMVRNAPTFSKVAEKVYNMLNGHVFVAHNVNFDYSFIRYQLQDCGYTLTSKKLCTIRLARKVIPGQRSYSLGNICTALGIENHGRHRAAGDALATVKLFEHMLANGASEVIGDTLKRTSKEQVLPPNVPRTQFEALPQLPGVYYFLDSKGKVVYVGKAVNIKKRVSSHFSNNSATRQRQNFMREVYHITCKTCRDEESAFELESQEIKRLWPKFNSAQKVVQTYFNIIDYTDQNGYKRLAIQKSRKLKNGILGLSTYAETFSVLKNVVTEYGLCPRLSGVYKDTVICIEANCICHHETTNTEDYNLLADEALSWIGSMAAEVKPLLPDSYQYSNMLKLEIV